MFRSILKFLRRFLKSSPYQKKDNNFFQRNLYPPIRIKSPIPRYLKLNVPTVLYSSYRREVIKNMMKKRLDYLINERKIESKKILFVGSIFTTRIINISLFDFLKDPIKFLNKDIDAIAIEGEGLFHVLFPLMDLIFQKTQNVFLTFDPGFFKFVEKLKKISNEIRVFTDTFQGSVIEIEVPKKSDFLGKNVSSEKINRTKPENLNAEPKVFPFDKKEKIILLLKLLRLAAAQQSKKLNENKEIHLAKNSISDLVGSKIYVHDDKDYWLRKKIYDLIENNKWEIGNVLFITYHSSKFTKYFEDLLKIKKLELLNPWNFKKLKKEFPISKYRAICFDEFYDDPNDAFYYLVKLSLDNHKFIFGVVNNREIDSEPFVKFKKHFPFFDVPIIKQESSTAIEDYEEDSLFGDLKYEAPIEEDNMGGLS